MRRNLLVVSEKKIKMFKTPFVHTDNARRRTMDAGPSTPYYKLTGELKNWTGILLVTDVQLICQQVMNPT